MELVILAGIATGLLSGLLGVGGGTIMIPALVLGAGLTQHLAQGISLAVMVPTALIGALNYYKKGHIHIRTAAFLVSGSLIGTLIGSNLAAATPELWLKKLFGIFAILVGLQGLKKNVLS